MQLVASAIKPKAIIIILSDLKLVPPIGWTAIRMIAKSLLKIAFSVRFTRGASDVYSPYLQAVVLGDDPLRHSVVQKNAPTRIGAHGIDQENKVSVASLIPVRAFD